VRRQLLPAVNIQAPWAEYILQGTKTIETRRYPLPKKYIGKEMVIIETHPANNKARSKLVGVVVFGKPFQYLSRADFYADSTRHLVNRDTIRFSWAAGDEKKRWGWPVLRVVRISSQDVGNQTRGIIFARQVEVSLDH